MAVFGGAAARYGAVKDFDKPFPNLKAGALDRTDANLSECVEAES